MWAANAATVSPAADTADGRVHLTPANLVSQFHRSIEPPGTAAVLARIFADATGSQSISRCRRTASLADEGAANHLRLCPRHGEPGIEVFVSGRDADRTAATRHPARQSPAASEAVARLHGLAADRTLFCGRARRRSTPGCFTTT